MTDVYRVKITDDAKKRIRKLDPPVRRRILTAITKLATDPRPPGVKALKGANELWRVRVGDWRVVYEIHDNRLVVLVVAVDHRSAVYRRI